MFGWRGEKWGGVLGKYLAALLRADEASGIDS